jgi:hypothetical protein
MSQTKNQQLNEKEAALHANTDASDSTAELAQNRLLATQAALIVHPLTEAEGLEAELKTVLASIRALNTQLGRS